MASHAEHSSPAELEQRAHAWFMTRDPRAMWPALDPAALQPAADAIGRVVPLLLGGREDGGLLAEIDVADDRAAYALGIAGLLTGVGPLLGWGAERGMLGVGAPAAPVLAEHLRQGRARAARIGSGLRHAIAALNAAGITPTVMKGMHTAYAYFPDPGTRPASDADIIVAPAQVPRAEAALRDAGFTPSTHVRVPYKRDWYPADDDPRLHSVELFDARDRWKLEVHGGVVFDRLLNHTLDLLDGAGATLPWRTFGVEARVPAPAPLVALLAVHASGELSRRRLLRLVEMALVVRYEAGRGALDWDAVSATLERTRATRLAFPALAQLERLLPGTVEPALLHRARRAAGYFARRVAGRITATAPILPDQVVLSDRLMWCTSPRDLLWKASVWLRPAPSGTWRDALRVYHMRLRLLLGGRVSWGLSSRAR